jgi:hypothetical protein
MTFKLSQRSLGNLEGVDKRLQKAVHHAIGETKVDFGVICGLRTIEEQRELVAKGASQTLKSKHLDGEAVDLMAYIGSGRRLGNSIFTTTSQTPCARAQSLPMCPCVGVPLGTSRTSVTGRARWKRP